MQVNPSRKADDGWTSCKYRGSPLLLQMMLQAPVSFKVQGCILCHGSDNGCACVEVRL